MPKFSDINFKYTDAEEERLYAPELIDQAYVDIDGILDKIQSPEKFLVIGPKGSGKTALSSKLQMMEKSRWDLFVDNDILEQFEFQLLDKTGGEKGTSGAQGRPLHLNIYLHTQHGPLQNLKYKGRPYFRTLFPVHGATNACLPK